MVDVNKVLKHPGLFLERTGPKAILIVKNEKDEKKILLMQKPFEFEKFGPFVFYTPSTYLLSNIACFIWQALGHNDFILMQLDVPQLYVSDQDKPKRIEKIKLSF